MAVSLDFLGAGVQRLQGEVAAVKNAINVLNQDILGVRGGMVGLVKSIEGLGSTVENLSTGVDNFGRQVDNLARGQDTLIQEVRSTLAAISARLDKLEH